LANAGVRHVWLGGSFISEAEEPKDVDGCWAYEVGMLFEKLDPVFLQVNLPRVAMKRKYGVDLQIAVASGWGETQPLRDSFARDKFRRPRGIVRLVLDEGIAS